MLLTVQMRYPVDRIGRSYGGNLPEEFCKATPLITFPIAKMLIKHDCLGTGDIYMCVNLFSDSFPYIRYFLNVIHFKIVAYLDTCRSYIKCTCDDPSKSICYQNEIRFCDSLPMCPNVSNRHITYPPPPPPPKKKKKKKETLQLLIVSYIMCKTIYKILKYYKTNLYTILIYVISYGALS